MLNLSNVFGTNYYCKESELAEKFFTFAQEQQYDTASMDVFLHQEDIQAFEKYLESCVPSETVNLDKKGEGKW